MISIIIPTYNEESSIKKTLRSIKDYNAEVLVIDGGSTDKTKQIVSKFKGVKFYSSPKKGRANQMNVGASKAKGDHLLFLHADTIITHDQLNLITYTLSNGYVGGAFSVKFDGTSYLLKINQLTIYLRSLIFKIYYGDQGIFVKKDVFQKIGGYQVQPILEDGLFSRSMLNFGKTKLINNPIITSSRKIEQGGIVKVLFTYGVITTMFIIGYNTRILLKVYKYFMGK